MVKSQSFNLIIILFLVICFMDCEADRITTDILDGIETAPFHF